MQIYTPCRFVHVSVRERFINIIKNRFDLRFILDNMNAWKIKKQTLVTRTQIAV